MSAERRPAPLVWVLGLGAFAIGTDTFVVAGVLRRISADLDVTVAQTGQLVTVFAVTFGIAAPVLAAATSRVPRRRLLLGGLGVFVVANIASALAPSFAFLLLTRVVAALGAAAYTPAAAASSASLVPEEQRGRALAIVLGGTTAATVLGVPAASYLGNEVGWQGSFGLVAGVGALSFVVLAVMLPTLPIPPVASLSQRLGLLRNPQVLTVILTTGLFFLGGFTVYTYLGQIAAEAAGVEGVAFTWLLLVFGVAGVLGNLVGGRLTDRVGPNRVLIAGLATFAAALLALPALSGSRVGLAAVLAVWALSAWSLTVPQQYRLFALVPQHAHVAIGLNSSAVFLGIGVSGAFGGLALGHVASRDLAYVGGAVVLLALGVALAQVASSARAARSGAGVGDAAQVTVR